MTMASAVGATPVPFADAALLVPIQTGMMASISQVYRVPMDSSLAVSLAATGLATNMGRSLVGSLLKMVPGAGSIVGGTISAAVAGAFTLAMGTAWGRICEMMIDGKFGPLDNMDNAQIKSTFMNQFKELFSTLAKQAVQGKNQVDPAMSDPQSPRMLSAEVIDAGYDQARHSIGRFNLGLFGLTGVGKSTLLNAVFGEELAQTGIGDPVTQGSRLYRHDTSTLGIFDTKGLEIGDDSRTILAELTRFVNDNRLGGTGDQIHVIWYCIRAGDRDSTRRAGLHPSGRRPRDSGPAGHHPDPAHRGRRAAFGRGGTCRIHPGPEPSHPGRIHFVNAKTDVFAGLRPRAR